LPGSINFIGLPKKKRFSFHFSILNSSTILENLAILYPYIITKKDVHVNSLCAFSHAKRMNDESVKHTETAYVGDAPRLNKKLFEC